MNISEIKQKYSIIPQTYKYLSILSFDDTGISFDKLITCLKHERFFIPCFAKSSIVEKRYIGMRYIPIVTDSLTYKLDVYKSNRNMKDDIYNLQGGHILIASNNAADLSKIKLTI